MARKEMAGAMEDPPRRDVDPGAFSHWMTGASLIEEDGHGPKVYWLADDRMLKLFRIKRVWSSNLVSPYALRFARNAAELQKRGFGCVAVAEWGRIPHMRRQYVLYPRVRGRGLRELLVQSEGGEGAFLESFAHFFGRMHGAGIYFRSCHFGNVLLDDEAKFFLIDVMDVSFAREQLSWSRRIRNFRHLLRYPGDGVWIRRFGLDRFLQGYEGGLADPDDDAQAGRLAVRVGQLLGDGPLAGRGQAG
ncbi:MAG TPA: hypothetical protein VMN36_12170 [Verrucomicrobiales bacterium]|nr:hypothetical protein [Verrucomicrobiales bacterium]